MNKIEMLTNGNIAINDIQFKMTGEGFPETNDLGVVGIAHNYVSADGSTAVSWHPVTNMTAFNEGDLDCCDWDNIDSDSVIVDWA